MTAVIDRQQLFEALSDQRKHTEKHVHHFANHIYFGLVKNGLKDGVGECTTGNAEYFVGNYVDGLRTGCGTQEWASGDIFHGFYRSDKRNGWGIYLHENGEKYEGTFFEDKKHGYGLYVWPDGSQYFGTFYLDKRSGYGILRYSTGSVYEGYFNDDLPEGPGVLWHPLEGIPRADIGYWQHGRLVRLVQTMNMANGFSWTTQFPEYTFYSTVRGEFIGQEQFDRLKRSMSKVQRNHLAHSEVAPGQRIMESGACFGEKMSHSQGDIDYEVMFQEVSELTYTM
ncbi:unnamed protein product [Echinostoma caproni]|uniref:MORN repeat-containing protein 5 n=1 Tax=Echinostoma caproni TaxID=27848 RepID=A0A183AUI9_9TREM|nr:unnamed protein product [Echinostoma caproni]